MRIPADARMLRRSLLRALALLALGAAVAAAATGLARQAAQRLDAEAARRDELRAATGAAVQRGAARHRELSARGVIGPERRSDWLDRLAQLARKHALANFEYELAAQQPAQVDSVGPRAGRYALMASTMKLRLGLRHERELLDFLAEAGESVSAILRVRACRIERPADADATTTARLVAECTIDWLTLREPA